MTTPTIQGDLFATRGHARALAKLLRERGHNACVEASGPAGAREFRVIVIRATDGLVAYFHEDDRVDAFAPHWLAR